MVLHFAVGAALGAFFRIGVMLAALAVIVVEGLLGWFEGSSWPWYVVAILAFLSVQVGYACAALLRPAPKPERAGHPPAPSMRNLSTPE